MLGFILHLIKIMPISDGMFHSVIDPLTIGLAIGGVKALAGGIQALTAGRKQAEPKYEIPKEVFDVTKQAQEMAQTGMPEASRMMALQGAQQSAMFGLRAAQDRRGGLASLGNIQAGLDRANLSVAAQDASMRLQNQRFAQQALMTQAQYRDKAFANQWQSWMNREQQRRAQLGAGLQNIMGGVDTAASIYAMSLYNNTTKDTTKNTTKDTPVATPPSATRFPAVQLPTYSTPAQTPQINALSGIINQPQLPTNMINTGGSFLFGNPM